jgi:Ca-activated chloride channel family protein
MILKGAPVWCAFFRSRMGSFPFSPDCEMRKTFSSVKLAIMRFALLFFLLCPRALLACDLALVLAVDVSGSVDEQEYRIQMDGLALALQDGIVADALIDAQARVSLIQWSGSSRQVQTVPWMAMLSLKDVANLADQIANDPRLWRNYSTAIGEALELSVQSFHQVAACRRKIIDVSGDGESNEGTPPSELHAEMRAGQIIVNAIAIETDDRDLTAYFFENLIVGEGAFVITANGFEDYPEQIRRKLQRETTKQLSSMSP